MALTLMRPPRCLAVNGNTIGQVFAQTFHPSCERLVEQPAGKGIHHVVQRVMRWNTLREGAEAAQKAQLAASPFADFHKILGPCKGAAQDQQHDFGQGIQHLAMLARVIKRRKMIEK